MVGVVGGGDDDGAGAGIGDGGGFLRPDSSGPAALRKGGGN